MGFKKTAKFKPGAHLIVSVQTSVCVFLCVCVCPQGLLITSRMIWTPYDCLNKGYSFYMPAVVVIDDGRSIRIKVYH